MKKISTRSLLAGLAATLLFSSMNVFAAPEVGAQAPQFTITDTNGNEVSTADLVGKTVVLEWTNHGCPYVQKHYESGNMQALQTEATGDEVVWLSVISSAEGKQGSVNAEQANELTKERSAAPSHVLLDTDGAIGRAYDARTTPHMYIIDASGKLAYMGGIDDKPTANPADIDGAENYVRTALNEIKDGQTVSTPTSRPYGCNVKYSS